jgi:hypothetical protein
MKHRVIKIVLERAGKRTTLQPHRADPWTAATTVIRGWESTAEGVSFQVHYDDGRVFVGHVNPEQGEVDVAKCMRRFCEFYALRRIPILFVNEKERFKRLIRQNYVRQHMAAVRWLDRYEIGAPTPDMWQQGEDGETITRTMRSNGVDSAPMTPSWS